MDLSESSIYSLSNRRRKMVLCRWIIYATVHY
jgi:hypothetical protein